MHCKICGDWTCEKTNDMHHLVAYATEEDLDGHFHYHDRNGRWQEWKCSKGHVFQTVAYNRCWCGWTSQYPELSNTYQFKPRKPCKGVKFSQKIVILNSNFIENLAKRLKKEEENVDDVSRDCRDECDCGRTPLCMPNDKLDDGINKGDGNESA